MELFYYTNAAGQRFPIPEQPLEPPEEPEGEETEVDV